MIQLYNLTPNVRIVMKARGLTSEEIYIRMGIGRTTLYSWIRNSHGINADYLKALAEILEVTPEEISVVSTKIRKQKARKYPLGYWDHETHYQNGKPCGYERALEICGGPDYLTSSEPRTTSDTVRLPITCDGRIVQR